jgi:hypothetical protein
LCHYDDDPGPYQTTQEACAVSTPDPNIDVPPRPANGMPGSPPPAPPPVTGRAVPPPRTGPGAPPAEPPQPRPVGDTLIRRLLPLVVSVVAVLFALVSLGVAWRALDQAKDAHDIALAGRDTTPGQQPTAQPPAPTTGDTGTSTATTPVNPTATGEPPPLDQRTVYKVKYDKQSLILKPQSSSTMYIDVDEPRVNTESGAGYDIELSPAYNSASPYFTLGDGVAASDQGAPDMTPQDCADRIRRAPVADNGRIPARQGLDVCLITSFSAAQQRGDVRRMVLMEVTGVAADGAVTVQLSAWDIPR